MKTIQFDCDNLGGLIHLYAVPPTSFLRIRKDYLTNKNYLELKNRDDVIDIPVYPNDTYLYNEEKTTTDAGDCWQVEIEGVIPRLQPQNHDIIELLERGLWYVVAEDANGEVHLCGQEDAWMLFSSSKTSGQTVTNRNGTSFTFSCVQDEPTIFLSDFDA